jgi:ABC-2 type transport system ATP-binding protein
MYEDLRCWEFLDLFAASYEIPRPERPEAIGRNLELVGLTGKYHAMCSELSRGMRQRLMLAKTLIPDPQVLILDEPASGVDPQGRIDLKNALIQQSQLGKTVLISSHILAEMTEFCTSIAIMQRGEMVVSGRIEDIRDQVMGAATLSVEVIGPAEGLLAIVGSDDYCGPVERKGRDTFEFRSTGSPEDASDLLARLVGSGVRVASFSRRKEGLEELFLAIGAKELS